MNICATRNGYLCFPEEKEENAYHCFPANGLDEIVEDFRKGVRANACSLDHLGISLHAVTPVLTDLNKCWKRFRGTSVDEVVLLTLGYLGDD